MRAATGFGEAIGLSYGYSGFLPEFLGNLGRQSCCCGYKHGGNPAQPSSYKTRVLSGHTGTEKGTILHQHLHQGVNVSGVRKQVALESPVNTKVHNSVTISMKKWNGYHAGDLTSNSNF